MCNQKVVSRFWATLYMIGDCCLLVCCVSVVWWLFCFVCCFCLLFTAMLVNTLLQEITRVKQWIRCMALMVKSNQSILYFESVYHVTICYFSCAFIYAVISMPRLSWRFVHLRLFIFYFMSSDATESGFSKTRFRIEAFEMWCWRKMLSISWGEHRTNDSILTELGLERELMGRVAKLKLQYFGHITRWSAGQLALTVLEGIMEGLRHQGRPRRQWIHDMKSGQAANTFS